MAEAPPPTALPPGAAEVATAGEPATGVATTGVATTEGPATGGPATEAGRRRWVPVTALVAYAACRGVTLAAVAVKTAVTHQSFAAGLDIWDGAWFLQAVEHGWPAHLPMTHGHVAASQIAFFPLYPLLVRVVAALGVPALGAALALSALGGLAAVVAVGLLARRFAGEEAAGRAALLVAVFPGSFVFSLAYAEGLAITCVALGLLALLDRRWLAAGLLGAAATAASPVALVFALSCAWAAVGAVRHHRAWRALVAPVLAPVGFLAYMAYLRVHTGTLLAWRLTERDGWHSGPSLLYPFRVLGTFLGDPLAPTLTGYILVTGTAVAVVGVVVAVRERQPAPVLVYGVGAVALAAVSQPVGLRPRFLLLAFPLIVAAGTRYTGWTHRILVVVSVVLLGAVTALEFFSWAVFP